MGKVKTGSPNARRALLLWADQTAANLGLRVLASGGRVLADRASGGCLEVENQDFGPGESAVSFGTRAILKDFGRRNGPIKRKLKDYDILLDTGAGDSFTDIYGLKRLAFIAYTHYQARRLRIPLILLPQTIGPFNSRIGRLIGRRSLRQAALVFARDPKSAAYSVELANRTVDATATDMVFALEPAIADKTRDVIINVSGLLWFGDDHVDSGNYRRETVKLIKNCLSDDRKVALLAHVVRSPRGNDDIDAIDDLLSSHPDLATRLERLVPDDLDQARNMLASSRVVIGARMHACLNALSQGVPAIPWAYSRKFAPLMQDLGWEHVIDFATCDDPVEATLSMLKLGDARLRAEAEALETRGRQKLRLVSDKLAAVGISGGTEAIGRL